MKTCQYCGKGPLPGARKKFCSKECRERSAGNLSIGLERECTRCGRSFLKSHRTQKVCSQECLRSNETRSWRDRITPEERDHLLGRANGRCEICGDSFGPRGPQIDHCHDTLNSRGVLCTRCNLGLGNFRDSVEILSNAVLYLRERSH